MIARLASLALLLIRPGEPVGPLTLTDQYEKGWQLSDLHGAVVILIDGDLQGSQFNSAWGRAVRARYQDRNLVHVVFAAHLTAAPALLHGFVRGKFLSKDPAHPASPILLDWKGVIARRFGFRDNVANIYVIDRDGTLRYSTAGRATQGELAPLFAALDGLIPAAPQ